MFQYFGARLENARGYCHFYELDRGVYTTIFQLFLQPCMLCGLMFVIEKIEPVRFDQPPLKKMFGSRAEVFSFHILEANHGSPMKSVSDKGWRCNHYGFGSMITACSDGMESGPAGVRFVSYS